MDIAQLKTNYLNKITSLKTWQFLCIAILCSETLTFLLTLIASYLLWGDVSKEVLIIGIIDSFVVSLIVAGFIIFFLKKFHADEQVRFELAKTFEKINIYEEHLRQTREKYRDLFENANDAIFLVDSNFKYVDVNQKAVEIFGFSKDEFLKMKITDVVPKDQLPLSSKKIEQLKNDGKYEKFVGKQVTKDGRWLDIEVSSSVIMEDGQYVGSRDIVRDITSRKHAENALKKAHDNLEIRVRERTKQLEDARKSLIENAHLAGMADIASGILHNVGNILVSSNFSNTKIMSIAKASVVTKFNEVNDLIREKMDSLDDFIENDHRLRPILEFYLAAGEELNQNLLEIYEEGQKLLSGNALISEIIMAQQKYVKSDVLEEFCPLEDLVNDSLNILSNSLSKNNVIVEKAFSKTLPVLVQRAKVVHIIINIIKNAIEAIIDSDSDQRKISIFLTSDNENISLKVSDTGCGIDKESLPYLFGRGFTTKEKGHGIGLHESSIQLVQMNGEIWAESDGLGKGASFIFKLPLQQSLRDD